MKPDAAPSVKKAARDRGWVDGVAYAVQVCANTHDEGAARTILQECGLSYNDFDRCDPYDRKAVRRVFRTEAHLRYLYEARKR